MSRNDQSQPKRTHAIVIGGSMTGLLHARILAAHFDQVTVIERDLLPQSPEVRAGVPQGRHVHALLQRGQQIMEELFPGLAGDLIEIGAPRLTWCQDTLYLTAGGWVKRFDSGIHTNLVSRPALEYAIRRRLTALYANVRLVDQTDVLNLVLEGDTVTGVRVQSRLDKTEQTLTAHLVLDATGRNSKTPDWLADLGYDTPDETKVSSYVGYATRWYEAPASQPDWKLMFIVARPAENNHRGGAIFQVEGNRWVVTLGGMNRDYPPNDEAAFLEFAKTLATPALYEAIKDATPISPIYGYRIEGNRLRHYEKLARRPENFIVTGDAVCGFNPLYGQGMTVAAMEAQLLDRMLAGKTVNVTQLRGFAAQFQQAQAKLLKIPWLLATGEDLRFPGTEGDRPDAATRFIQTYMDEVFKHLDDEYIARTVIKVTNLTTAPTRLFGPEILARILWRRLRGQRSAATPDVIPAYA